MNWVCTDTRTLKFYSIDKMLEDIHMMEGKNWGVRQIVPDEAVYIVVYEYEHVKESP